MKPLVSVIVPTKNSSEFLTLCLHDIARQEYPNVEIIVVDNHSTDDTRWIEQHYTEKRYVKGPERAVQDNFGINKAKGSIIWLTGSDFRSDPTYIAEGVAALGNGYDAIYASVLTDRNVRHYWGKVKALERLCYIGDDTIESARFFKKSVWTTLGGFDERLVGVEEDFQHRLDCAGYKTGRIKSREYHMHEECSLKTVFSKHKYYGGFAVSYISKHGKRAWFQLFPFRAAFFRHVPLLIIHPILTIGLVIYKVVQYYAGALGYLQAKTERKFKWD